MKKGQNKKEKITWICFLLASVCFYIAAIIGMISKDGNNVNINLCLGSAFLCLSTVQLRKNRNNKEQ